VDSSPNRRLHRAVFLSTCSHNAVESIARPISKYRLYGASYFAVLGEVYFSGSF